MAEEQIIVGRVDYTCERCGKNIARWNGEKMICLNCGYEPIIKKSDLIKNFNEMFDYDTTYDTLFNNFIKKLMEELK